MEAEDLTVIADAGYFKSEEIMSCHEVGITANMPKPQTSGNHAKGSSIRMIFAISPNLISTVVPPMNV